MKADEAEAMKLQWPELWEMTCLGMLLCAFSLTSICQSQDGRYLYTMWHARYPERLFRVHVRAHSDMICSFHLKHRGILVLQGSHAPG